MADDRSRKVLVLLNAKAGTLAVSRGDDVETRIKRGFSEHGIDAQIHSVTPAEVQRLIEDCQKKMSFDAIIVGGGDGTLNCAANALTIRPDGKRSPLGGTHLLIAFGVLPLGTHNHFARDLKIPLDLDEAIAALAQSLSSTPQANPLAVAEVNGEVFLNFSGVGLHPKLVEEREVEHAAIKKHWPLLRTVLRKLTKPLAMVITFLKSLNDLPVHRLTITANGQRRILVTSSVIVCTNPLQIEQFGLSELSVPKRGVLNVYIAHTRHARGLIRLAIAVLTRQLSKSPDFEWIACEELTIDSRRRSIRVSLDGEVVRMSTPLKYRIIHDGLSVIVPKVSNEPRPVLV